MQEVIPKSPPFLDFPETTGATTARKLRDISATESRETETETRSRTLARTQECHEACYKKNNNIGNKFITKQIDDESDIMHVLGG